MNNVFTQEPPFAAVYQTIINQMDAHDPRVELNGFHPDYPMMFESWYDSEIAMLTSLDYLRELKTVFPRFAHLVNGYGRWHKLPSYVVDDYAGLYATQQLKKYMKLRDGALGKLWASNSAFASEFPGIRAFTGANLSQHQRTQQSTGAAASIANLKMLVEFMNGEMIRLSDLNSRAHWSVRPPHTFVVSGPLNDPGQLPPVFFENPEVLMTEAQMRMANLLRREGLYSELFHMRQEDHDSLFPAQQDYFRWWKMAATAVFTHPRLPVTLAIIPDGVPPFMFRNPNFSVPFYAAILEPLCIADSCYLIWNFPSDDVKAIEQVIQDTNINAYVDEFRMIAAAMQLVVMNLHILCAAIPVGRGNRKPQWLQSPPNTHFVRATQLATHNFAETLTLFGIDRVKVPTQKPVL